jgi:hypothetical protein
LNENIAKVLVVFPEVWTRSKRQYVKLSVGSSESRNSEKTKESLWLGRKYDFSANGSRAKVEYDQDDIEKLENAPDSSILYVRNDKREYKFEKINGKWIGLVEAG